MIKGRLKRKELSVKDFIDKYLEGNMRRFLRKHKDQWFFLRTYSRTLRTIKRSNKTSYEYIMSHNLTPNDLKDILNIFITLDKHFNISFSQQLFYEFLYIWEDFTDEVDDYMMVVNNKRYETNSPLFKKHWLTKQQAFIEQKARGFIHINDWEGFDRHAVHIISNINRNYYYPINIFTSYHERHGKGNLSSYACPYIAASKYGVNGHTGISFPTSKKVKKKFKV